MQVTNSGSPLDKEQGQVTIIPPELVFQFDEEELDKKGSINLINSTNTNHIEMPRRPISKADIEHEADKTINILKSQKEQKVITQQATVINYELHVDPATIILKLDGIPILSKGNLCMFTALAGIGKSQVMESICASFFEAKGDTLGFEGDLIKENGMVLLCDGERTPYDCKRGFTRVGCRITGNSAISKDDMPENFEYRSYIKIEKLKHKKEDLFNSIDRYGEKLSLLVLDGSGDWVADPNDATETSDFVGRLIALANKYGFGIVTTMHNNPGAQNDKARGHLGSELWRKAECVLTIKKETGTAGIRSITSHGSALTKNRNAVDSIKQSFMWSEIDHMMVCCDYTESNKTNKLGIFEEILSKGKSLSSSEICRIIMERQNVKIRTAKDRIKDAKELAIIKQTPHGSYILSND